jgi:hypothetical protein
MTSRAPSLIAAKAVLRVGVGGEHQNWRWHCCHDFSDSFQAAHYRHHDIHDDKVRFEPDCLLYGRAAITDLTDNFNLVILRQEIAQDYPGQLGIIRNKKSNHGVFKRSRSPLSPVERPV